MCEFWHIHLKLIIKTYVQVPTANPATVPENPLRIKQNQATNR